MYKNIIFDFGGVVVDFAPKEFLMNHFRQSGMAGP